MIKVYSYTLPADLVKHFNRYGWAFIRLQDKPIRSVLVQFGVNYTHFFVNSKKDLDFLFSNYKIYDLLAQ